MTYAICGSHGQRNEMENLKDMLEDLYCDTTNVVIQEPCKCNEILSEHYENWMDELDHADLVFILTKPDGTISEATSYELAYCRKNELPYILVGHEVKCGIFMLKKD